MVSKPQPANVAWWRSFYNGRFIVKLPRSFFYVLCIVYTYNFLMTELRSCDKDLAENFYYLALYRKVCDPWSSYLMKSWEKYLFSFESFSFWNYTKTSSNFTNKKDKTMDTFDVKWGMWIREKEKVNVQFWFLLVTKIIKTLFSPSAQN